MSTQLWTRPQTDIFIKQLVWICPSCKHSNEHTNVNFIKLTCSNCQEEFYLKIILEQEEIHYCQDAYEDPDTCLYCSTMHCFKIKQTRVKVSSGNRK